MARRKVRQFNSIFPPAAPAAELGGLSPPEQHAFPERTTVTTPGPHRDLTVVPLIAYQRYYGEDTVRIWCGSRGDAVG
jgi:hypothetical protein